jgi:uncharacterized protein YoxC
MLEILQWILIVGLVLAIIVLNSVNKTQNKVLENLTEANENLTKMVEGLTDLVRTLGGWSRHR